MQPTILCTESGEILIKAGSYTSQGQVFTVPEDVSFPVPPAPIVWVENEVLQLSIEVPQSFNVGTPLSGPNARDINALDAFIPESLSLRLSSDGGALQEGRDYLLSARHALLGIGSESRISPADTVYATYAYGLMRLDSVFLDAAGHLGYTPGIPHITTPLPPSVPEGVLRLANIFRPYQSQTIEEEHIFPVLELPECAKTVTITDRIPNTLRKLKNGERVVIVCWGDSVTAGGNASEKRYRYTDVFAEGLQRKFPQATIEVHNVSVGGSSSVNWLYPAKFPFARPELRPELDFGRVIAPKPDLVTLEFVNDVGLDETTRDDAYEDIRHNLGRVGAEWILITPHFTNPSWMGIDLRGTENRSYVSFVKTYASDHHLGLADASGRWEHLWKEGIPFITLLHNSVNHPDDRGHRIFAEELWKCFEG